jgi:hypothetical protein
MNALHIDLRDLNLQRGRRRVLADVKHAGRVRAILENLAGVCSHPLPSTLPQFFLSYAPLHGDMAFPCRLFSLRVTSFSSLGSSRKRDSTEEGSSPLVFKILTSM